jgi:DMSO/TMAO reductase YedYZ molybdopterin-dependent catalytic subunit
VPKSVSSIVPTGGWRIYTVGSSMPDLDPATYRLSVGGLVAAPTSFSLADLKAMPRAEQVSDFHCVTGWSVANVHWAGVRLPELLRQAGATGGVSSLRFVSAESPYEDSLTLRQASLPDVMLAYEMNGGPISRPHGAPVRLVMPEMYGYKSVKWVSHVELGRSTQPGFWEQHGYDVDAWIGRSNGL